MSRNRHLNDTWWSKAAGFVAWLRHYSRISGMSLRDRVRFAWTCRVLPFNDVGARKGPDT